MSDLTRKAIYGFLNRRIGDAVEARQFPPTGQTTSYRTGDDGDLEVGNPTANRFQTIGSVVLDRLTGLMWPADYATSPGSPFDAVGNWNDAIDACLALDHGGYDDWRMPNVHELASILDFENGGAYSPFTVTTAPNPNHWTSTTYQAATTIAYAWGVTGPVLSVAKFKDGSGGGHEDEWVIPVRGGI